MARNFLDRPMTKNSINFTGTSDPFESQVRKLTSKNRKALTKIVDSGADFPTIQKARRELELAENSARLKIATTDASDARKAQKFHNIVISVEGDKRDKANATVRKLRDAGRVDSNTKTQLTFAIRTAERSSEIIRDSQSRVNNLQTKLDNSIARQRQFSSTKKGTFSP